MQPTSRRRGLSFVWLVVFLASAGPALAQGLQQETAYQRLGCREVRSLDAIQYWFWEGYFGIVDLQDLTFERWGRIAMEPTVCFRIALTVIDDVEKRTAGYRRAVTELLKWIAEDEEAARNDPDSRLARQHLERITGESFDTRREWLAWWNENRSYVLWSEDSERLEVVEDARDAGESLYDDALLLDAEEYWFYAGRGWVSESNPVGEFVLGSVLIPPHGHSFRVPAGVLTDRAAKERGYRRALQNLVVDGLVLPELGPASLESVIEQMRVLTGEAFDDRDTWIGWWNQNRRWLVLSPDSQRLVVSPVRRH